MVDVVTRENEERAREIVDKCETDVCPCIEPAVAAALDEKDKHWIDALTAGVEQARAQGRDEAFRSEQYRTSINVSYEEGREEMRELVEATVEIWMHMNVAGENEDALCDSLIGQIRALWAGGGEGQK